MLIILSLIGIQYICLQFHFGLSAVRLAIVILRLSQQTRTYKQEDNGDKENNMSKERILSHCDKPWQVKPMERVRQKAPQQTSRPCV